MTSSPEQAPLRWLAKQNKYPGEKWISEEWLGGDLHTSWLLCLLDEMVTQNYSNLLHSLYETPPVRAGTYAAVILALAREITLRTMLVHETGCES